MRLIDADVMKDYIDSCGCCGHCKKIGRNCQEDCEFPDYLTDGWERAIDEQPTVDAIPVEFIKEEIKNTKGFYSSNLRRLLDTWAERKEE